MDGALLLLQVYWQQSSFR